MTLSLDPEVSLKAFSYCAHTQSNSKRGILHSHSRNLIDRYLDSEFGIHAYLRARNEVSDLKTRDFAIVFEETNPSRIDSKVFNTHARVGRDDEFHLSSGDCGSYKIQSPVTIYSRPVIQDEKHLSQVPLQIVGPSNSTRIRLYSLKERFEVVREFLHAPCQLLEIPRSVADGKVPLLRIGGRILSEHEHSSVIDAGIEPGSELIKHLAKMERERQEPVTLGGPDEELSCPVVIYLGVGTIELVCLKSTPYVYEGLAVRLCPINSVPAILEW